MKIDITETQQELLLNLIQEEIIRTESGPSYQYRSQVLRSLRSLEAKLDKQKEVAPGVDRPAYYDSEGGSMCNGLGRSYF